MLFSVIKDDPKKILNQTETYGHQIIAEFFLYLLT